MLDEKIKGTCTLKFDVMRPSGKVVVYQQTLMQRAKLL